MLGRKARRHVRRGGPFQQMLVRPEPPERDADRAQGDHRVAHLKRHCEQPAASAVRETMERALHDTAPPPAREPGHEIGEQRGGGGDKRQRGPHERPARQEEPAGEQQCEDARRDDAATEIVEDLEPIEPGEPVRDPAPLRIGDERQQPDGNLPVAPNPAVPAPGMVRIARRKAFIGDDVGDQRDPAVEALEQIVAEQRIFRDAAFHAAREGLDLVNALAHEDAGAEQVLIDVRHGARIDVDGRVAAKEAAERGAFRGVGRDLHARLEDGVAAHHAAGRRIEMRLV